MLLHYLRRLLLVHGNVKWGDLLLRRTIVARNIMLLHRARLLLLLLELLELSIPVKSVTMLEAAAQLDMLGIRLARRLDLSTAELKLTLVGKLL